MENTQQNVLNNVIKPKKRWYKRKWFWIPTLLVAILIIASLVFGGGGEDQTIATAHIERGDLTQTIDASGSIESLEDIDLAFEVPGTLAAVYVEVGEVDSQGIPFELSDQEDPPPVDAVSLDGEDLIEEELAPAVPESDSPNTCPWCRENLPGREGVKFCPFCGSNVQLVPCPDCGEELELSWRFCIACGTEVSS